MEKITFGIHAVQSVLENTPGSIRELLIMTGKTNQRLQLLERLAVEQKIAIRRVTKHEMVQICGFDSRHQGVVVICDGSSTEVTHAIADEYSLLEFVKDPHKASTPLILILDGVTDPHNLGACLRTCDAVGVDAVVVPKDNAASLTAVVSKVACGAAETVPLLRVTNISRVIKSLQECGVWVYGFAGGAATTLYQQDLRGAVALVFGAEEKGIRQKVAEQCDGLLQLPMLGRVESLNVSVATGIGLYEVLRQRML